MLAVVGFSNIRTLTALPGVIVRGIDISTYAIENAHQDVKHLIDHGTAAELPYPDKYFDLVFSINTLHNLHNRNSMSVT